MAKGETIMELILIGGPHHNTIKDIPDHFPIQMKDRVNSGLMGGEDKDSVMYVICKTGDGKFYGVYDPVYDPSIERINRLRSAITNAIEEKQ
jgi:GTPase